MKFDIDRIKKLNSLSAELDRYGIAVDQKGFSRCPFHTEKTASFRVYPDGTFHCFGCGAYGDVIAFVMKMENLPFGAACARLDRDITYSEQRKIERARREREKTKSEREKAEQERFCYFDLWKDNEEKIKLFQPGSPYEKPSNLFLYFLGRREMLSYLLDCAEIKLYRAVNKVGF